MPAAFQFPTRETDIWLPFVLTQDDDRSNVFLRTVGRLKPGVSVDAAHSELRVIAAQLEREYPDDNAQTSATVHLLREQVTGQQRTLLVTLVSASLCLLLIACMNLANLFLARALVRQRELAVRTAMGASGDRLIRQLMVESFSVAGAGGIAGVVLALLATPFVARLVPTTMPIPDAPTVDLRMMGIAAALTLATALTFGVLPALRAIRGASGATLRESGRTGTGRATERWRSVLVATEIAATVVLLVASGLLGRALWNVQQTDPGFRAENVLTARTTLAFPAYAPTERRQQFYDRVIDNLKAMPGVTNAAYTSFLPLVMRGGIWPVTFGSPNDPPADTVSLRLITPGYFATMGIPLHVGRDITAADTLKSTGVAIVSRSFVQKHWPAQDPIGRQFFVGEFQRTVIGVVGDVRVRGLERESEPQVYFSSQQVNDGALPFYAPKDLVVRASVPAESLAATVRSVVNDIDPNQPVSDVRLLSNIVDADSGGRRTQFYVVIGFAAVAFVLAGVGVHGLLAFAVMSRTREIGVRIALGARPRAVLGLIMKRGLSLSLMGAAAGTVAALGMAQLLQSLLVGVTVSDPVVFGAAVTLVGVMALMGALLPALRATAIDPISAIKNWD
jgi:predicted permease